MYQRNASYGKEDRVDLLYQHVVLLHEDQITKTNITLYRLLHPYTEPVLPPSLPRIEVDESVCLVMDKICNMSAKQIQETLHFIDECIKGSNF